MLARLVLSFRFFVSSFPAGLHLSTCSDNQFLQVAEDVADVLSREVSLDPTKQVIIRSTLPTHSVYSEDGSFVHAQTECWKELKEDHFTNYYMEQVANAYGLKYLYSAPIYMERGDLHFERHKPMDCVHWCYSSETYVPELALINNLLR